MNANQHNSFPFLTPLLGGISALCLCFCWHSALLAATPTFVPLTVRAQDDDTSAGQYLDMAHDESSDTQAEYMLRAAQQLISANALGVAKHILRNVPESNSPTVQQQFLSTWARWYMARRQPWQAIKLLRRITPDTNNPKVYAQYLDQLSNAYAANGELFAAMRKRLQRQPLLDDEQQRHNLLQIWRDARQMKPDQIKRALRRDPDTAMAGWLVLAQINQHAGDSTAQWQQELAQWSNQFPKHMANGLVVRPVASSTLQPPKHIAVLLPASGPNATSSKAIRQGIITAYYSDSANQKPTISWYDSAGNNVRHTYDQAVSQGADLIIGPLSKQHVEDIGARNYSVPTVVLNNIAEPIDSDQTVVQFALSPIDEGQQIANRAWSKGYRHLLVVAADTRWGRQQGEAFKRYWQQMGGDTIIVHYFNPTRRQHPELKSLLGVTASEQRIAQVREVLGTPIKASPARRRDIDALVLLTTPQETYQIYPLMKFYYLTGLTTYGLSQIASGSHLGPNYFRDLSHIYLPITAWIGNSKQLPPAISKAYQQLKETSGKSFSQNQALMGFGFDAYQIATHLGPLVSLQQHNIVGATGKLSITPNNYVHRQMRWGVIKNNRVTLLAQ